MAKCRHVSSSWVAYGLVVAKQALGSYCNGPINGGEMEHGLDFVLNILHNGELLHYGTQKMKRFSPEIKNSCSSYCD